MPDLREIIMVQIIDGKPVVSIIVNPKGEPSQEISDLALKIAEVVSSG
ncbi:MAG: hypothetical protein ACYSSO_07350 [Planctomycetota bacterium]|jgi:hypothetical protein